MSYLLLMCRSLTYAQRTARVLEHVGVSGYIQKSPQKASSRGCGYCVKIREYNLPAAKRALEAEGLLPERILLLEEEGSFREVAV